jgi:hypothetical protein
MKARELFLIFFLIVILFVSTIIFAGSINNSSAPVSTGYTLTDIYNLIHEVGPASEGVHNLYPSVSSNTLSSYSVSQLYADLANLIKRENVETGVSYLGVTGDYGNPDLASTTTTVITASLTPTVPLGNALGYSLDDIWNLIDQNATTTPGTHANTPAGTPADSGHSLTEIYERLVTLIEADKIANDVTYLGVEGNSCLSNSAGFMGGDGSTEDPYQICSWTQLDNMRNNISADYIMVNSLSSADSDYAGLGDNWTPVATSATEEFTGNFDGKNNTISDLIITPHDFNPGYTDYVGLFGVMGGNISNIGLININISSDGALIGALAGYTADEISITNSYSTGEITAEPSLIGGLIGEFVSSGSISNSYSEVNINSPLSDIVGGIAGYSIGSILDSYATGNIIAFGDAGGLVGMQRGQSITNCYATGNVTASDNYIGGLVGFLGQDIIISNSYATGNVSGFNSVGGLVGLGAGTILNSFATGNVTGTSDVGGLVGWLASSGELSNSYSIGLVSGNIQTHGLIGSFSGNVSSSFWDIETSNHPESHEGTGTTTLAMQTPTTFTDAGWLDSIWNFVEGEYPTLK